MLRIWLAVWAILCVTSVLPAQDEVFPPPAPEDEITERLQALESEVARLKQEAAAAHADPKVEPASFTDDLVLPAAGIASGNVKYPTLEVHGVFQADSGWFGQDAASRFTVGDIQDGASFRRARLSANGSVVENMNYFLQMDFAFFGRPTFTDLWMEVTDVPFLGNVRVGQWKQPFSLEVVSSFRYTTFAERSLLFQPFTPFRHIAVGFYDHSQDENWTWAASIYRAGQDQFGGSLADSGGYATVGRITYLPYYECEGTEYLHLGWGNNLVFPNNRIARFRSIPEYFVGEVVGGFLGTSGQAVNGAQNGVPFFIDTGNVGIHHYWLTGPELLLVDGPLSLQSEIMYLNAERTTDQREDFWGYYVQVGYFLTGEHRPYNRQQGAIDRVKPFGNVLSACDDGSRGVGAWELATRVSHLDLHDNTVRAGQLTDWTLGLNWYLNPYSKLQFNYIRAYLENPFVGPSNTDIYGLRAQVDF